MALKDLLLFLDGGKRDEAHVELTVALAQAHGAALTGLFVERRVAEDLLLDAPPSGVLMESLARERDVRRAEMKSLFEKLTRDKDVRCEFCVEAGDPAFWLGAYGCCSDLIVIGQPGEDDDLLGNGGVPGTVALTSGRPVLVIPRAGARTLNCERTIVAWNGSREAARAVNDAMPLLKGAAKVEVLTIGVETHPEVGTSAAEGMSRHLARHGVRAEPNALPRPEADPARVFMSHANRYGADMVVMGAYGHSRLREFVLGGMTRELLNHSPVPLFLSH